ncbi:MAG: MFS transporter [Anaerolineae bacterium]|nr:MFS transporter [Anaerolineae bacterium]
MNRRLALILGYVFVDVLGFSLILPLLPFYAQSFQASPTLVGLLLSANAVTQAIGAPLIGRLSDRYGRRPMIMLSLAGTLGSFLMLGFANSLAMLYLSRVLDGFLGGNISLAQAYIADITDDRSRARGLGLIGAAFGVGFIFGPAIGGTLSAGGNYALPAFIAAALSAINLLGVLFLLPESLPAKERAARSHSPATAVSARALWQALRRPCVGPLLSYRVLFGLAFTMFQTVFALYASRRLGLDAQGTSYILAYVGILIVLVQGGGIALLTRRFGDKQLVMGGTIVLALSLLAWALAPTLWVLLVVLAPLALSAGVTNVVSNSALTKSVRPEEVGGTLGLSAAIGSMTQVVSPLLGGLLIDGLGSAAPGVLGALIVGALVPFVWRRILTVPDAPCPAQVAAMPGPGR